ncbi:ATP-binding protein [Kineococcus sp. LSe6-4]|uniref:ATP-binding protein n=1 Tax=Kineococcus halophytocola TaxID=3234027 RepID=A0ABV4GXM6_9ACTN
MPSDHLTLPSEPGAVAVARRWALERCRRELGPRAAGREDVFDAVELLTSEVVANAVVHGAPPVRVEVECAPGHVTVAVHDGSPEPPRVRARDLDSTGGRGVALVDVVASAWGSRPGADGRGKVTWFRCEWPAGDR